MNLKEKIIVLLESRKYTYNDLANYLEITETELDTCLEVPASQIRILENISKALSISLYGFLNGEARPSLPSSDLEVLRLKQEVASLMQEIERLKLRLKQQKLNKT